MTPRPHIDSLTRGVLAAACVLLAGCSYLAELAAPRKAATTVRTEAALQADAAFWRALHGGDYAAIGQVLEAETGAYLRDPGDAVTAAHVGWLHIWRLSERRRLDVVPATITDDATLARQYFEQAVKLDVREARYLGFLASTTLAEGSIHHDERVTRHGWFMLLEAKRAWPEFNLFTAGYVLSPQPASSERFRQALAWQWDDLDACVGATVDRRSVEYFRYLRQETREGPKRVCWNSWIAPHNFEGFFMNLGDMLVKSGDWDTARRAYADARLSPTYAQWPFRAVLERRISEARENVVAFNSPVDSRRDAPAIMAETPFSCMACHQQ